MLLKMINRMPGVIILHRAHFFAKKEGILVLYVEYSNNEVDNNLYNSSEKVCFFCKLFATAQ